MCGITGIVDFRQQRAAQHIRAQADTLQHRGPDDAGFASFYAGEVQHEAGHDEPALVALAHRRLSILDLSPAGHNPMPYRHHWITFNGEVYNYIELRAELEQLGHSFQSETDTEVILAAYDEWGTDCLARFNGMFAFAIWDGQQLFIARDRFGIKPLYYFWQDGYFAFASEIKALLANPHIPSLPNRQKVYDYLVNGAIISDTNTFFEGIHQLPGSHALTLKANGDFHCWRYYDFAYQTHYIERNYRDAVAQFRDLLTDAIRLRLRSDVPVGSSLSGGLDSSSVVTLVNRFLNDANLGDRQRVFCAVYAGERFDERPYMEHVIKATGAAAHFTHPSSDALWAAAQRMVWHQDEPFNSTAIFAQYSVMQLVRQNDVTVLLDGQGADEVLGGYHHYYGYFLANALRAGRVDRFLREAVAANRIADAKWMSLAAITGYNLAPEPLRKLGWRIGGAKMQTHKPIDPALIHPNFTAPHAAQIKHNPYTALADKLYDDVWHTNLPTLLRYEDRNSMAFSIEARVPYLDHRLVEFAFSLGADAHIREGWTKTLLRDAMQSNLPPEISRRRDKEGYTTPQARWMQELTPHINALFSGHICAQDYLSPEAIRALQSPQAGAIPGVWRLINLELWLRAFVA